MRCTPSQTGSRQFVCQDNDNTAPGTSGNQNFTLVPLERVVGLAATTR
jgi:myo-inositol-hexaphosphate 3-phosphohydrolase